MSWQKFDQSRQPEPLFSPFDPVKNWFANQSIARREPVIAVTTPVARLENRQTITQDVTLIGDSEQDPYISSLNDSYSNNVNLQSGDREDQFEKNLSVD